MKETLLVIAAGLIVAFLIFQSLRGFFFSRRKWKNKDDIAPELSRYIERAGNPSEAREVLREIDQRAVETRARTRSRFYHTAGEIALTVLKRPNVTVRYCQRALRNDPTCETAFERLAEILIAQKKYRRLERVCWGLLSRLNEDESGGLVWKKFWSGLVTVYANSPRLTERADAIRKMLDGFEADIDEGFENDADDNSPDNMKLESIDSKDGN